MKPEIKLTPKERERIMSALRLFVFTIEGSWGLDMWTYGNLDSLIFTLADIRADVMDRYLVETNGVS